MPDAKANPFAALVSPAASGSTSPAKNSPPNKRDVAISTSSSREKTAPSENGSTSEGRTESTTGSTDGGHRGDHRESTVTDAPAKARTDAGKIIERIGRKFVELRETGRSQAWAQLESELMRNAALLIETGLISAKDWVSMAIEIEGFRKSESGSQQLPGDFLANWLAGEDNTPHKRA